MRSDEGVIGDSCTQLSMDEELKLEAVLVRGVLMTVLGLHVRI